jgi:hypothetical protein
VRALSVVTSTEATWALSGRTKYMSAPPASTAEITGATPRSAAAAPADSAATRAPSYVSAGTSMTERSAAAPAIEMASSSSGVSPLVPMAPTTSASTRIGMPPVSAEAPRSASAPRRPFVTCSSISRLGRTNIAAVRALSTATRDEAIWAPGVRRSSISSPCGSTTAMTTRCPCAFASRSAAAITAEAPASSMILRVLVRAMGQGPFAWRCAA